MITAKENIDQMDVLAAQTHQAGLIKKAWKAQGDQLKGEKARSKKQQRALIEAQAHARLAKEELGDPKDLDIEKRLIRDRFETIELICGEGLK